MNNPTNDIKARELISENIYRNYFVEAGAGSGKTSSLVTRMVNMVLSGIPVEQICAITFTKAAANEFYSRFYAKLSEISANKKTSAHDKELADHALQNIDLCFLGTMDSFVSTLISEHPVLAKVPSGCQVLEDIELKEQIFRREYSAMIHGGYGPDIVQKYIRYKQYFWNHEQLFVDLMCGVVGENHDAKFTYSAPSDKTIEQMFESDKRLLSRMFDLASENLYEKKWPIGAYAYIEENIELLQGYWDKSVIFEHGNFYTMIEKFKSLQITCDPGEEFSIYLDVKEIKKTRTTTYSLNKTYLFDLISKIKAQVYGIAMDFITNFSDAVFETLRQNGEISFFDYKLYVRDMLRKDAENGGKLINHISKRHSYFLLDEFQDTAPIQSEIFFYLATDVSRPENLNRDWRKCVPRDGSLFIVGDPKQSIYRFQNADIQSYMRVKNLFDGNWGDVLELTRNFRSSKEMCNWFNDIFGNSIFKEDENFDPQVQGHYTPIPAQDNYENGKNFGGLFEYEVDPDANNDAIEVCSIINRLVHKDNLTIVVKDKNNKMIVRPIEFSDIMVVTKKKASLEYILNEMKANGIPARTNGYVPFNTCNVLIECAKIYYACVYPNNENAAYLALTGPYCGWTKQQIYEHKVKTGRVRLKDSPLQDLSEEVRKLGCIEGIYHIVEELDLMRKVGTENLEYFYFAVETLRGALSDGSISSMQQCADMLKKISENNNKLERCLNLSTETNAVSVANLHKVKGLEAPIVILAMPKTELFKANIEKGFVFEGDDKTGYIFSKSTLSTDQFPEQKDTETNLLRAESMRLLYVAATRAKVALIVGRHGEKDGLANSSWNILIPNRAENIDEFLEQLPDNQNQEISKDESKSAFKPYEPEYDGENLFDKIERSKTTYCKVNPSKLEVKHSTSGDNEASVLDDSAISIPDSSNNAEEASDAAIQGTLVHRALEILVSNQCYDNADDETLGNLAKFICYEEDADEDVFYPTVFHVVKTMLNGGFAQTNDSPQNLLSELRDNSLNVYTEVPFSYLKGENLTNGIIDLLYCDKNNNWHIIDYKTNANASGLDDHYSEQLNAYIQACKETCGVEADAKIYHIEC